MTRTPIPELLARYADALRIALVNNKGGVGKTFLICLLAECFALLGVRVLVVDMDPQGNATRRLKVRPTEGKTLLDVLRHPAQKGAAASIIHPCGWDGFGDLIHVLPAMLDLEDRALEAGLPAADRRLRKILDGADEPYGVVLIDCPPSLKGHLTTLAIAALNGDGDMVLIPLEPEQDAIGGANRVVEYLRLFAADLGVEGLNVGGLLVNGVRTGTLLHEERADDLATLFPGVPVLATVALRARIAEVQDGARPLSSDADLVKVGLIETGKNLAHGLLDREETA